jgi:hypothetical protein
VTLTAARYRAIRQGLGMTNAQLCAVLGKHMREGWRYEAGATPVPETVARLLWMICRHGVPQEWEKTL